MSVRKLPQLIVGAILLAALYLLSKANYLLFHSIVEAWAMVVAICIFIVAWNTRDFTQASYLVFLGLGYLFVAILTFFHLITYYGMSVIPNLTQNQPTQFWIFTRFLETATLVIAPLLLNIQLTEFWSLGLAFGATTLLGILTILVYPIFPACFLPGLGLTPFKIASEYLIVAFLSASIYRLYRHREEWDEKTLSLLVYAMIATILSELSFTLYDDVYGLLNFVGHIFQVVSFYFIYKAIVERGLRQPHSLLHMNLQRAEQNVQAINECFLSFGPDHDENIRHLVKTAGQLLGADFALFNLIEHGRIRTVSSWNTSMQVNDQAHGHLCEYIVNRGGTHPRVIGDLQSSSFAATDPSIQELGLETYVGCPVRVNGQIVGTICTVHRHDKRPTKQDLETLATLARALGSEAERKGAETALRRLKDQQDVILSTVPVLIWSMKDPVTIEFGNREYANFLGLNLEAIRDAPLSAVHHPDDAAEIALAIQEVFDAKQPWRREYQLRDAQGNRRWFDVANIPLLGKDRQVEQVIGLATDITDRKLVEGRINEDLERARRIHATFLPQVPKLPDISFGTYYQPAAQLGGDFYDIYPVGDEVLVYLVDVSGHGLDGAICTVFVRETIRSYLAAADKVHLPSIIRHLRQSFFAARFPDDYFFTTIMMVIDPAMHRARYVSAGAIHPPISSQRGALPLSPGSLICGLGEPMDLQEEEIIIAPGETIVLCTDGVFEQQDPSGRLFGVDGVFEAINSSEGPQESIDRIAAHLKEHSPNLDDDLTILAIHRHSSEAFREH